MKFMIISIINPIQATYIFIAIFSMAILLSLRSKKNQDFFPIETTNELKGLAILLVIFGHIGYFLVDDHSFLFPLSTIAGVGVDIFLFLSGYGLVISALKKNQTVFQFYKTRLIKLLIPLWVALGAFFLLDFFILNKVYTGGYILSSFLGLFTSADLYNDINSPLWYFTLILFYYLIFPLIFIKKYPCFSAIIIYILTYVIMALNPVWFSKVKFFYEVHLLAFPTGVFTAGLILYSQNFIKNINLAKFLKNKKLIEITKKIVYYLSIFILLFIIGYTVYNSGIGKGVWIERLVSLTTTLAFVGLFLIKKLRIELLYLFGLYSYEIYLLHWPILYRYDFIFKFLPPWLSMVVYLGLFIGLGWILQKITKSIYAKIR